MMAKKTIKLPNNYLQDGKFHHFAVVYDDENLEFSAYCDYTNSVSEATGVSFKPRGEASYRIYAVGSELNATYFEGLVNEVRLVRSALSPAEFLRCAKMPCGGVIIFR